MGLDMYLTGEIYLSGFTSEGSKYIETVNKMLGLETKRSERGTIEHNSIRAEKIIISLAYWRKANAIHNWFVKNVQEGIDNCDNYYLDKDKLEELLNLCNDVLETKDSSKLLPKEGFFFGSTENDKWYYEDLKNTVSQIEAVFRMLEKEPFCSMNLCYQSSW